MCRTSYSENLTALKKCLLWRGRFSENIVALKLLLHIQEEASSFEKKKIMSVILSYCLNICFLSQYFFLGVCFGKSALNSIDLFQGLRQGVQFKGSYLWCPGCSSENVPSISEKFYHLFELFPRQLFALLFMKSYVWDQVVVSLGNLIDNVSCKVGSIDNNRSQHFQQNQNT